MTTSSARRARAAAPDEEGHAVLDRLAVAELIVAERQARDNGDWDTMLAAHTPEATTRLAWFSGAVGELVDTARLGVGRGGATIHRLSPPAVTVAGPKALAETRVLIETRTEQDGVEIDLSSHCRYVHRLIRGDDGWRITKVDCVCDRDRLTPVLTSERLLLNRERLARYRPSYRFVSYHLEARGITVDPDLPGVDRPESVEELYKTSHSWLTT